jgi:uncharacterized FlaG/YvyC family protein
VGDWIRNHTDEIISHNSKYNMQNAKDHTKVETYYNKRHKNGVKEILEEINRNFLDGAAIEIGGDSE